MCGIAGFSLSEHSKVNARALAHHLLAGIETRGSDASGYAYSSGNGTGVHKDRIPGSQLPLSGLPRDAKQAILHTRLATQGSVYDNRNNHPVISPKGDVALVHNGVISNDDMFRRQFSGLPAVDSSVLPALIERDGIDGLADTAGYAAIAWLDGSPGYDPEILHVARISISPVAYTWLRDGSFVWASTTRILGEALLDAGLYHGHIFEMGEGDYFQVRRGVIYVFRDDIEMADDWGSWYRYGSATSGNRATNQGSENVRSIGSSFGNIDTSDPGTFDDDMTWDEDYRARAGIDSVAMAMADEDNGGYSTYDENGTLVHHVTTDFGRDELMGFYVEMEDGSIEVLDTLEDLEGHLGWLCNMAMYNGAPRPDIEHTLKWVNWVRDLGHITLTENMVSWVANMAEIDQHESPAVYSLNYIRDGVGEIITMTGV